MPYRPAYNPRTGERTMIYLVGDLTGFQKKQSSDNAAVTAIITRALSDPITQKSQSLLEIRNGKFTDGDNEDLDFFRLSHVMTLSTVLDMLQRSEPDQVEGVENLVVAHPWAYDEARRMLGFANSTPPFKRIDFSIGSSFPLVEKQHSAQNGVHATIGTCTKSMSERPQSGSNVAAGSGDTQVEMQEIDISQADRVMRLGTEELQGLEICKRSVVSSLPLLEPPEGACEAFQVILGTPELSDDLVLQGNPDVADNMDGYNPVTEDETLLEQSMVRIAERQPGRPKRTRQLPARYRDDQ